MKITETIRKRKSSRTYNQLLLSPADKTELEKFIFENRKGINNEVIEFSIVEREDSDNQLKINYGMIQGHKTFVLGASRANPDSRLNYGYLMEKVVLKATEMGIGSCWVGYFDQSYFKEIILEAGFEIPSILIVGYAQEKQSAGERLVRLTIKANKRKEWDQLFFNYQTKLPLNPEQISKYTDSLEMLRLAPSSGNTQPWRIFYDETTAEFHFFKKSINKRYEEMGLHDIDLGISMAHFELTSISNELSGEWIKNDWDSLSSVADLHYFMSWKCK